MRKSTHIGMRALAILAAGAILAIAFAAGCDLHDDGEIHADCPLCHFSIHDHTPIAYLEATPVAVEAPCPPQWTDAIHLDGQWLHICSNLPHAPPIA